MYKILDLFCGAGGFSWGMSMNKNFEIVCGLDLDNDAANTFRFNHPNAKVFVGDIQNIELTKKIIDFAKEKSINMIIGGPPCQGFSMKGKKLGLKDPRNFLFLEFLNYVEKINPEIFIMENVSTIFNTANNFFLKKIVETTKKLGYKINYKIINAVNFGIPQNRSRAIIICSKKIKFQIPITNHSSKTSIKDAISDLNFLNSGEGSFKIEYLKKPLSDYQKTMRKKSKFIFNHISTKHSKETLYKLSLIPEKGTKKNLPLHLRTNQKFKTTWSRLHWDDISPTIDTRFDTPSNGKNTHPTLNRSITAREAARIQSFSDDFVFFGRKSSICRQIGNAVPPLLAKSIADAIIHKINANDIKSEYEIIKNDCMKYYNFFEDNYFDAIITDPPYNISQKNNFEKMKNKRRGLDFGNWDKNFDLYSWIKKYYPKLKNGGSIIIFSSFHYISHIIDKLKELGAETKNLIKWKKLNPFPKNITRRYVTDTEFAIWAVKPKAKWTFNKPKDISYLRPEFQTAIVSGKEKTAHPTQKSLKLMKHIISIHTNENDIIIDPFMGSGTVGVAANLLKRRFFGIEKNSDYFEIALMRLKNKK